MEMQISLAWVDLAHLRKKQKKASGKSLLCFTFQTTDAGRRFGQTRFAKGRVGRRIKVTVGREEAGTEESRRVRDVHIPEVLPEGAGALIVSSTPAVCG